MRVSFEHPIIQPGYPKPLSDTTYEVGQYAPSELSLSYLRLLEAKNAGLFYDPSLDIYDEEGNISEKKLEQINVEHLLSKYFDSVDPQIPRFAAINIYSVLNRIPNKYFFYLDIKKISWIKKSEMEEANDFSILGFVKKENYFELLVYQPYYLYLVIPLVRPIHGYSQGLSVSSYATAKIIGRILFFVLGQKFPEILEDFIETRQWTKEQKPGFYKSGEYFYFPSQKNFYHGPKERFSYFTTLSPQDDFAEGFVYYYFHRLFFQRFPEFFAFFKRLEGALKI